MFGKSKQKAVAEADENGAREAEIDRLCKLPLIDLAELIMPAFGPDAPAPGNGGSMLQENVINYLLASYRGGPKHPEVLKAPVREALQKLEHAELVVVVPSATLGGIFAVTRLGRRVLAEGTVRQYLDHPAQL